MQWLNLIPQRLDTGATPTFAGLLAGDGTAAAPSISFSADSDTGFYRASSGNAVFSSNGAVSLYFGAGGTIQGAGFTGYLALPSSGAVSLFAAGTNQNITLTPSGTGVIDGVFTSNGVGGLRISNTSGGASAYAVSYFGTTATPTDVVIGCVGTGNSAYGGANSGFVGTNGNKAFAFLTNGAEVARFHANGRLGIGTTTDSGALLQVGANAATGSALAGMSFGGADLTQYRSGTGEWTVAGTAGSAWTLNVATGGLMTLTNSGGNAAFVSASGGNTLYMGGYDSIGGAGFARIGMTTAHGIKFYTNFSTLALTLDASQNATFAGTGTQSFAGTIGIAAGKLIKWGASTRIDATANGSLLLADDAGTNFSRLQFGGATASFPALARSTDALAVVLADNSNYARLETLYFSVTDGVAAPGATSGRAKIFVDTADGDLKIIFADGTVKTIVTDT